MIRVVTPSDWAKIAGGDEVNVRVPAESLVRSIRVAIHDLEETANEPPPHFLVRWFPKSTEGSFEIQPRPIFRSYFIANFTLPAPAAGFVEIFSRVPSHVTCYLSAQPQSVCASASILPRSLTRLAPVTPSTKIDLSSIMNQLEQGDIAGALEDFAAARLRSFGPDVMVAARTILGYLAHRPLLRDASVGAFVAALA